MFDFLHKCDELTELKKRLKIIRLMLYGHGKPGDKNYVKSHTFYSDASADHFLKQEKYYETEIQKRHDKHTKRR